MSNDDKRRRQDGSTAKLSVADLLARREAETQPIPRITDTGADTRATARTGDDEETVRFSVAALSAAAAAKNLPNLSGRELHITELLRREGRAGEEERGGGGFSVPKLVAMASGGVVLAGTVAFTATNLMSSPDERPLAEVRFDARPAARATNTLTKDLGAAAAQQQAQQQTQAETTTTTPEQAAETTTQRAPRPVTQQPTTTTRQQETQQAPPSTSTTTPAPSSSTQQTTTPPPPSTTTPPAPSSSSQPPSSSTPPPSSSTPSTPSTPPSDDGSGIDLGLELDLGGILNPIGGFDFFAPAS
ncbi:hypothetical protein [Saccharothrix texasensis]|uniref:Uncharacterized protein n=1 Tax=Saccharothrix texasensis TaxID=103734 RepID=A0A3N1HBT2_9PSEU|nr:hypothetical protein [Saccharothrix texasensis]ROP39970.1 hypothetical protein EDD40_5372 [Saccharothrix texasensis]